jgi:periplasmic divalent cation tolerance protein
LVEERLAACVNILSGVASVYIWKDELCQEDETMLVIKSNRQLFQQLAARIVELHTYEVPEIIALPVELGHKPYLDWINSQVGPLRVGKET